MFWWTRFRIPVRRVSLAGFEARTLLVEDLSSPAADPIRYRLIMLAAVLEKACYVATMGTLLVKGLIQFDQFAIVAPDLVLGVLFVAAFVRTPVTARRSAST